MADLNKLFVSNLLPTVTDEYLTTLFGPYGVIIDCVIMRGKGRGGRQSAFVKFATGEEAEAARAALDRFVMDGDTAPLTVRLASKKPVQAPLMPIMPYGFAAPAPVPMPQYTYVSAGGMVAGRPDNKRSLGSYVQDMVPVKRPRLQLVSHVVPQGAAQEVIPGYKLYVSNLEPSMDEAGLYALFAPYGNILETVIIRQRAGRAGRLSGFVKFADMTTANLAANTMNGMMPMGFTERLTVKFAN